MSSARSGPSRAGSRGRRKRRDPRRTAARLAAPVAFLAAVTIAVLLVRSGLGGDDTPAGTTVPTVSVELTQPAQTEPPTQTTATGTRFYRVQTGDTLEGIAAKFGTSVETLLELNPKADPVALTVGQKIRVR